MKLTLTTAILILGCLQPLPGQALSFMHRAQVKEVNGLPCFALDGSRVVRRNPSQVVMVHVAVPQSAAMSRDGKVVWSVGFPPDSLLIKGAECVSYGVASADAEVMVLPAPLRPGVAYSVSLNTDVIRRGRLHNRVYSGEFCLSQRADGSTRVHDLWESNSGVPAGNPCRELYRTGGTR